MTLDEATCENFVFAVLPQKVSKDLRTDRFDLVGDLIVLSLASHPFAKLVTSSHLPPHRKNSLESLKPIACLTTWPFRQSLTN